MNTIYEINGKNWIYYRDAAEYLQYPKYKLKYEAGANFNSNKHLKIGEMLMFEENYIKTLKTILSYKMEDQGTI